MAGRFFSADARSPNDGVTSTAGCHTAHAAGCMCNLATEAMQEVADRSMLIGQRHSRTSLWTGRKRPDT